MGSRASESFKRLLGIQPFERKGTPTGIRRLDLRPADWSSCKAQSCTRRRSSTAGAARPAEKGSLPRRWTAHGTWSKASLEASKLGWRPASKTPLNPQSIGPHRRFDWTELSLKDIKAAKSKLGGTVNDVVLATAAGALGHFLREHRTSTTDIDFRTLIPVSVRGKSEKVGNQVAMIMAELPVGEREPVARLHRVMEIMQRLKSSKQALGVAWLESLADKIGGRFFTELSRRATRNRPFNVAITNVPGPQFPLYFLESKMSAIYPMLPMFPNQALAIAVLQLRRPHLLGASTPIGTRSQTSTTSSRASPSSSKSSTPRQDRTRPSLGRDFDGAALRIPNAKRRPEGRRVVRKRGLEPPRVLPH